MKENPEVIIADDEPHCRMMIKGALRGIGFNVIGEAENGEDAFNQCVEKKPDLVCLDFNMPIMSGLEALQKIMELSPETACIMLTSVADAESVNACIEAGAAGYVRKDTPVPEMRKIIQDTWKSLCEDGE
ncbi:MAG: response regulator transcription factor [Planctomycetota bacterium]|jgi:two-component system chemotaxis response regulator CheY